MQPLNKKVSQEQCNKHIQEREHIKYTMSFEDALDLFKKRNHGLLSNPPANVEARITKQETELRRNELAIEAILRILPTEVIPDPQRKNDYLCPHCNTFIGDMDSIYVYDEAPNHCEHCGQALRYSKS